MSNNPKRQKAFEASIKACAILKEDCNKRQEAVDSLLEACVKKGNFELVEHILDLYPSTGAIDEAVINGFKKKWCGGALELIKAGLTSKETLDFLVKFCITEGWVSDFESLTKLRKTRSTKDEINSIIKSCIQEGYASGANNAAKLRGTPLSVNEIDLLVKTCIKKKEIADARMAATWGASKEMIKFLGEEWTKLCIKEGLILDVQKAAEIREKPLTIAEIKELTQNVQKDNF